MYIFTKMPKKFWKRSQNQVKTHTENHLGHPQMTAYPESALSETALTKGWLIVCQTFGKWWKKPWSTFLFKNPNSQFRVVVDVPTQIENKMHWLGIQKQHSLFKKSGFVLCKNFFRDIFLSTNNTEIVRCVTNVKMKWYYY